MTEAQAIASAADGVALMVWMFGIFWLFIVAGLLVQVIKAISVRLRARRAARHHRYLRRTRQWS